MSVKKSSLAILLSFLLNQQHRAYGRCPEGAHNTHNSSSLALKASLRSQNPGSSHNGDIYIHVCVCFTGAVANVADLGRCNLKVPSSTLLKWFVK